MSMTTVPFVTVAVLFLTVSTYLTVFINKVVLRAYMDEIFHIPQAQKYCAGNFKHWDPKITTPPGLYLVSVGLRHLLSTFLPQVLECSLYHLRSVNLLFAFGNLYLCNAILNKLNFGQKNFGFWHSAFNALTLSQFPLLYFFTFLYYTDAGSTFAILLSYLLALHGSHFLAAVIGAFAILFRQTNVIWITFFASLALTETIERFAARELRKVDRYSWKYLKAMLRSSLDLVTFRTSDSLQFVFEVITSCGGYVLVGAGFVTFVVWNKGVALGDRKAHEASVHLPQLLYFSAFTLIFSFPHLFCRNLVSRSIQNARKHSLLTVLVAIGLFGIIAINTRAHPYLLADNRHYPFYVWRKFFGRHPVAKFLPIPLYMYAGTVIFHSLRTQRGIVWATVYALCVAASVVLHELLEFRYFIIPYLVFRLNLPLAKNNYSVATEFSLYSVVNGYTLYLFIMRPFVLPTEDILQRFMW